MKRRGMLIGLAVLAIIFVIFDLTNEFTVVSDLTKEQIDEKFHTNVIETPFIMEMDTNYSIIKPRKKTYVLRGRMDGYEPLIVIKITDPEKVVEFDVVDETKYVHEKVEMNDAVVYINSYAGATAPNANDETGYSASFEVSVFTEYAFVTVNFWNDEGNYYRYGSELRDEDRMMIMDIFEKYIFANN